MENKLGLLEFSQQLVDANDLDPVYVLLHNAELPRDTLEAWLLAYWSFYHVGTASWITQTGIGSDSETVYWSAFMRAAGSSVYPRSHERRHYRGENARKSSEFMAGYGLESIFGEFRRAAYECRTLDLEEVLDYVLLWEGFGPWAAFKVADMLERLDLCRVRFDTSAVMQMYDSPRKGAELHHTLVFPGAPLDGRWPTIGEWAVNEVLNALGGRKAPPRYERPCGVQEAETCLCKWKSYRNGKYEIGEDVAACRKGLLRFARCRLSKRLLRAGERGGLW